MSEYEEGILRSLRRLTRAIDLYSRQLASRYGLTGPQLVCVRVLARLGPSTPSVLAREMDLSQATVTGILDRLDRQGLILRTRDIRDRRRVLVTLTAEGANVTESAPSALHDIFSGRLEALPPEEQLAIHISLERVVEMMGAGHFHVPVEGVGIADAQILSMDSVDVEANDRAPEEADPTPPAGQEEEA